MPAQESDPADRRLLIEALSDSPEFATVRQRQMIVRHALAGYPLSEKLDRPLRYLDWQGSPLVVADDLVRLLNGHEAAPGVPALGLIALKVEPIARPAHRERLEEMRKRLGWGADLPAQPADSWRDDRSDEEVVRERIIGEDTLRPIHYLHWALRAAEAVVRVRRQDGDKGTGFLVAPNLLMTNNHVVADDAEARGAAIDFHYELAPDGKTTREMVTVGTSNPALAYTNPKIDFTLMRLEDAPTLSHYLPLRPARVKQDQRVVIIQHPGGFLKRISLQNNLVAYADDELLQYYTSTEGGSSGSPVFDDDFRVVAIHHSSVQRKEWDGGGKIRQTDPGKKWQLHMRNQGASMVAVVKDLRENAPDLLQEIIVVEDE